MRTINVMGYEVFSDDLNHIDMDKKQVINTINPHSYITAKNDALFREALLSSDVLLPDGIGIIYASKLLSKKRMRRVTGTDIHKYLLTQINAQSGKVFYLGSSSETLQLITEKIKCTYPGIRVSTHAPPFKTVFSKQENENIISHINTFQPDILFVGMTAPKQEKWVFLNKKQIQARIICSVGAVFDFYAGTTQRPPNWMIRLKLEWLGRLLREPTRMWKRNFVSTPLFIKDILISKLRTQNNNIL